MNKERKGRFNDVISSLEEAKGEVEDILNEEQDSYDSLPDGLQMSSRGEKMQDYIGLMEDCISKIDKVVGFVEEKIIKKNRYYLCISNTLLIFVVLLTIRT